MKSLPGPEGPEDSRGEKERTRTTRDQGRRRGTYIPNVDEILEMLMQLNQAVVIGAMSTKVANIVHRNLRTVLDVRRQASEEAVGAGNEALAEVCREHPQVLNALEPFLSDEQITWLSSEITEDGHDSV